MISLLRGAFGGDTKAAPAATPASPPDPYEAMQKPPSTDTLRPEPTPKIIRPLLFSRFLFAEHDGDEYEEPWNIYSLHRVAFEPDATHCLFSVRTQAQAEALMKALDDHEARRIGQENAPLSASASARVAQ